MVKQTRVNLLFADGLGADDIAVVVDDVEGSEPVDDHTLFVIIDLNLR